MKKQRKFLELPCGIIEKDAPLNVGDHHEIILKQKQTFAEY